jgi:circadian clock protein KaiB
MDLNPAKRQGGLSDQMYHLRLYVAGTTPRSARTLDNITRLCEEWLPGRHRLEVIDLYQQPELAKEAQIVVVPTLIRKAPLPARRIIGDLSDRERLLAGLDL